MEESCSNCIFFKLVDVRVGVCRKNPPSTLIIPKGPQHMEIRGQFPPTPSTEWCGEWRTKAELTY